MLGEIDGLGLSNTDFGKLGPQDAVPTARRIMDLAEQLGDALYMMTLRYSKASDVLPHKILLDTLHRIPDSLHRMVPKIDVLLQDIFKHGTTQRGV
eukprot:3895031-Amphidinium_carterae.1